MNKGVLEKIAGISMFVFPLLLLAGFLMHPDILSFHITQTGADLARKFHHEPLFHVAHLIVFLAVPFIVMSIFALMLVPVTRGGRWITAGGFIGIFGAIILAGDKGALCIVLSAFESLDEVSFAHIMPALTAIVERRGLLAIFYALPLLPLGAAAQLVGLIRAGKLSRWAGGAGIIGLLLLNNPDIECISSIGALVMCIAYFPLGLRMFNGRLA